MRKSIGLLMIALSILLAACGAQEAKTVSEVLEQAVAASQELESYTADIKMDTEMMGMEVSIEGTSDITHNPDTLYLEMKMGMMGMTMDVETYVVEDEVYMGMFGEWFIVDEEEMGLESFDQLNEEELEKLNAFADQFEMTEEDDVYVLTLSGEGEAFKELIEPYLEASMEDFAMDPSMEEALANITVNSLEMEMRVEQKTMLMQSQTVTAEIEIDGEPSQIHAESTISNVNGVDPVVIPEEVKENAVAESELLDEEYEHEYEEESLPLDEIKEIVDYTVPEVTAVPEGYEMTDSYYYSDEFLDMVYLLYEKDAENGFVFTIYPSKEVYGEVYEDDMTETVSINGNEGVLETISEDFLFLTWEHDSGVFLELMGEGSEMTKEVLLQIAESVE